MKGIKKVKISKDLGYEAAHREHILEMNHSRIENIDNIDNIDDIVLQSDYDKETLNNLLSIEHIEELVEITSNKNSTESTGNAKEELLNTVYGDLAGFDKHIEDNVNLAGYGTREAVVVAMLSLFDYTIATNKRIKYLFGVYSPNSPKQTTCGTGRQDPTVITLGTMENPNGIELNDYKFGMDCSGVVSWVINKAGYSLPGNNSGADKTIYNTSYIYNWASKNNYVANSIDGGQKGDLIVTNGHVFMIVESYEENGVRGYYIAEETLRTGEDGNAQNGLRLAKLSCDEINEMTYNGNHYVRVDMTDFYNNKENVR